MKPVDMKIKTEILQGVFIVTFEGTRLDASFAQDFFSAMEGFIQKGHVDILLDMSAVDFVDSTGLGSIVRCLKEIGGRGQLVLCGVNEMVINLLQMTRLNEVFIQAKDRNEALSTLSWEKKKKTETAPVPVAEVLEGDDDGEDGDWAILLEMEDGEVEEVESGERRRFRRIEHKHIVDGDIIGNCTNTSTGKHSTAVILNISPGGLLMVSPSRHSLGDEIIVQGSIGTNFKLRETAVVRSCRDGHYGLEFTNPSEETRAFLNQLTGAVGLTKMDRMRH